MRDFPTIDISAMQTASAAALKDLGSQVDAICRQTGFLAVVGHGDGIHARPGEAFGIAIAEMIVAGCLPFVPAEGGPSEIVDHNPALVYDTVDEAVEKIDSMLV